MVLKGEKTGICSLLLEVSYSLSKVVQRLSLTGGNKQAKNNLLLNSKKLIGMLAPSSTIKVY